MSEELELADSNREHGENPSRLTLSVSVTISIIAVLVAAATLLGHRAHTEELLKQAQASDQWNFYQAKNIRQHLMQAMADGFDSNAAQDKAKSDALRDKYNKEAARYQSDKDAISEQAKDFEKERDLFEHKADRFDSGEGLLDVGLVICSVTLLTKRKFFWFSGMILAAVGVVLTASGFLLH